MRHQEAIELVRAGLVWGMIGNQFNGEWPAVIWAVDADGILYEARETIPGRGVYHGYPLQAGDDFEETLRNEWERRRP